MTTTFPIQILRFKLSGDNYAFDVLNAREVLTVVKITPLPSALPFLSGVINLRGSIIPVIDLRKKFGLTVGADTADTSIIIVEVDLGQEKTIIGAVVDAVVGVSICEPSDLEAPPRFGMQLNANLIRAISKRQGDFVVILDTNQVFSEEELRQIQGHSLSN